MALFESYAYFVFFYTLFAPLLPYLWTNKHPGSGIWPATGVTLLLLVVFNVMLWPACDASNCGQGAIAIATLWLFAIVSAVIMLIVAGLVGHFRQRKSSDL